MKPRAVRGALCFSSRGFSRPGPEPAASLQKLGRRVGLAFGEAGRAQGVDVHRRRGAVQDHLGEKLAQRGGVHHPVAGRAVSG